MFFSCFRIHVKFTFCLSLASGLRSWPWYLWWVLAVCRMSVFSSCVFDSGFLWGPGWHLTHHMARLQFMILLLLPLKCWPQVWGSCLVGRYLLIWVYCDIHGVLIMSEVSGVEVTCDLLVILLRCCLPRFFTQSYCFSFFNWWLSWGKYFKIIRTLLLKFRSILFFSFFFSF